MLPWHSLFQWAGTKESPAVNQCFCLKKILPNIIQRQRVLWYSYWNCKTYRNLQDNPSLCVLISLTRRQTHKQPLKGDCIGSHIWGSEVEIGKSLSFALGLVMVWKNVKTMTKATTRKYREQVVIAASPSLSPQTWNQPRGFDFSDKDPEVCLLFMSAKMCEKMPDL